MCRRARSPVLVATHLTRLRQWPGARKNWGGGGRGGGGGEGGGGGGAGGGDGRPRPSLSLPLSPSLPPSRLLHQVDGLLQALELDRVERVEDLPRGAVDAPDARRLVRPPRAELVHVLVVVAPHLDLQTALSSRPVSSRPVSSRPAVPAVDAGAARQVVVDLDGVGDGRGRLAHARERLVDEVGLRPPVLGRHPEHHAGPDVEGVAVPLVPRGAAAGREVLFQHDDGGAGRDEPRGRGEPPHAPADDDGVVLDVGGGLGGGGGVAGLGGVVVAGLEVGAGREGGRAAGGVGGVVGQLSGGGAIGRGRASLRGARGEGVECGRYD